MFLFSIPGVSHYQSVPQPAPVAPVSLKTPITEVSPLNVDIMVKIAFCESGGRQFNSDGTVIRGRENPKDVGKFQINEYYHLADSKRLGMDIYTLEGNTAYATHLYETQGTKPWSASLGCWQSK